MLYVSTRNFNDTHTAHRAFNEERTPGGGFYVPMKLPVFSQEDLAAIKKQSCSETIAQILSLFSGLQIAPWDVECAIGRDFFRFQNIHQKLVFVELWRNPNSEYSYVLSGLYSLLEKDGAHKTPVGWPRIAIEIAVLFGVYSAIDLSAEQNYDFAVNEDDMAGITAVIFAKKMGLPVNFVICACDEESIVWSLTNKNEFSTRTEQPAYLECFIYSLFGQCEVLSYLVAAEMKCPYCVDEDETDITNKNNNLYSAVVSNSRIETIISGVYSTNQYSIDPNSALAYGSLQDYRAQSGVNRITVIFSKQRGKQIRE